MSSMAEDTIEHYEDIQSIARGQGWSHRTVLHFVLCWAAENKHMEDIAGYLAEIAHEENEC